MYNIEKALKQFELTVEGGKLDGCLVYHEAVKDFIVELMEGYGDEVLRGLDKLKEELSK